MFREINLYSTVYIHQQHPYFPVLLASAVFSSLFLEFSLKTSWGALPGAWPKFSPFVEALIFYTEVSIPGRLYAKFLNSCFTLIPTLALVSINITPRSLASYCPSSVLTALFSAISILLPTRMIRRSWPLIDLASSIHLVTLLKLVLPSQKIININFFTCNVIDNYCNWGILNVTRDKTSKSFLPSCIPQLESDHFFIDIHSLW